MSDRRLARPPSDAALRKRRERDRHARGKRLDAIEISDDVLKALELAGLVDIAELTDRHERARALGDALEDLLGI